MPTDAPTPEQPTRRSRRELRAQTRPTAQATSSDAVDATGESAHPVTAATPANVPVMPTTGAFPATRRSRRQGQGPASAARPSTTPAPRTEDAPDEGRVTSADESVAAVREPVEPKGVAGATDPIVIAETAPETDDDAFLEAVRALNFTGATDVVAERSGFGDTAGEATIPSAEASEAEKAEGFRRLARRGRRVMTTAAASSSAMAAIGLLLVGFTTPLGAIGAPSAGSSLVTASASIENDETEEEIQAFVAGSDVAAEDLDRVEHYDTTTFAELADVEGINTANAFFTNDPTADIQWPYVVGTGMSHGYGMRWGRLHQGIDFTPGDGAPIQAIADGTVRVASESGGGYGVHVYIDHVIDGQMITSHYAHMQYGSLQVTPGQSVEVGDIIGLTGNTGHSFGAHLHFELLIGDSTFDPLPWLQEWAGTHFSESDAEGGDTGGDDVEFASEDAE